MIPKVLAFLLFATLNVYGQEALFHHNHPTTEEWLDAINDMVAPGGSGSYGAVFTSYPDDVAGNCKGGGNAAALNYNSWLWKAFGPGPSNECKGGQCKCGDGSSCPHGPNNWQCDATCKDWSPLICGPKGALKGCRFTACGDAGCSQFFVHEGCQCKHPCNFCKTRSCSPPDPIHFDLCLHTSRKVCKNQSGKGYVKDVSCYNGMKRPAWVDAEVQEWVEDAQLPLLTGI